MHALFHIHPSPDKVFASIVVPLYADLATSSASSVAAVSSIDTESDACSAATAKSKVCTHPTRLARVLFTLGQGAICSLVFTERVANLAKKYAELQKAAESNAIAKEKANKAKDCKGTDGTGREGEVDAMEEEMGMVAAADAEHERVRATKNSLLVVHSINYI